MTPMNDFYFLVFLKKDVCFNMKLYRKVHNILVLSFFFCLYLIHFSCVYIYT